MDCGPLTAPEDGEIALLDGRTTFGARARFTCKDEHALLGDSLRTCGDGGKWAGEPVKCLCEWTKLKAGGGGDKVVARMGQKDAFG